jgi:ubiquinone/menaquinone biosynthesis C-methylase UbiE
MFIKPEDYSPSYYNFQNYNTKHRMITYWHQIDSILQNKPKTVLEIGLGTGLVSSYLRSVGVEVTTLDINPKLKPDYVGSVLDLDVIISDKKFDLVLCARVLHHLPYNSFSKAIEQISLISKKDAIVTLPVDDFRFYIMSRYTSSKIRTLSIPIPIFIKRGIVDFLSKNNPKEGSKFISGLWKINDKNKVSFSDIKLTVEKHWKIVSDYKIPEDSSHYLLKLTKK